MDRTEIDELVQAALKHVRGIVEVYPFHDEDRQKVLEIEDEAEKRSLMGLGKVINVGVREVMRRDLVYLAVTDTSFDWTRHSNLLLKKGDEVVGEEVQDEDTICRLAEDKNVWFMHRNFVVYKNRVSFPKDIMKKICHFEIPCIPAEWCVVDDEKFQCKSIVYGCPATPCDAFLKQRYAGGRDERGAGTILIGITL